MVHFSIQYRVIPERVSEAFYRLTNVKGQMESFIFDTVRAQVPMIPFDQVFLQKEEISKHIKDELSDSMESFGYEIVNSLITDIEPTADLKNAMNEIVRQERLKMAAEYQGDTQRIIEVKNAEAEGEKIRIQAAADAEAKFLNGQGIARQRAAIISGMRNDVRNFSNAVGNVGAKDVLHLIILTQYLDTLRDVAGKSHANAVFVPQCSSPIVTTVRDGFLQASMSQGVPL